MSRDGVNSARVIRAFATRAGSVLRQGKASGMPAKLAARIRVRLAVPPQGAGIGGCGCGWIPIAPPDGGPSRPLGDRCQWSVTDHIRMGKDNHIYRVDLEQRHRGPCGCRTWLCDGPSGRGAARGAHRGARSVGKRRGAAHRRLASDGPRHSGRPPGRDGRDGPEIRAARRGDGRCCVCRTTMTSLKRGCTWPTSSLPSSRRAPEPRYDRSSDSVGMRVTTARQWPFRRDAEAPTMTAENMAVTAPASRFPSTVFRPARPHVQRPGLKARRAPRIRPRTSACRRTAWTGGPCRRFWGPS
jgi:hypothetical protein